MQAEEYARMFQYEGDYWWFVGRRRLVLELLNEYPIEGLILDAGCGTGAMLCDLSTLGTAVGLDIEFQALRYARQRGDFPLLQARLERLPFPNETFSLVTALDVLEHLPDEMPALHEIERVLKPQGLVVFTAPAYQWLWSKHDVALHHYRRYTARALRTRLEEARFEVLKLSYSVTLMFLPILLFRWVDRLSSKPPTATVVPLPPRLNRWLTGLQSFEARLIRRHNLPFGVSLVAVARKRG